MVDSQRPPRRSFDAVSSVGREQGKVASSRTPSNASSRAPSRRSSQSSHRPHGPSLAHYPSEREAALAKQYAMADSISKSRAPSVQSHASTQYPDKGSASLTPQNMRYLERGDDLEAERSRYAASQGSSRRPLPAPHSYPHGLDPYSTALDEKLSQAHREPGDRAEEFARRRPKESNEQYAARINNRLGQLDGKLVDLDMRWEMLEMEQQAGGSLHRGSEAPSRTHADSKSRQVVEYVSARSGPSTVSKHSSRRSEVDELDRLSRLTIKPDDSRRSHRAPSAVSSGAGAMVPYEHKIPSHSRSSRERSEASSAFALSSMAPSAVSSRASSTRSGRNRSGSLMQSMTPFTTCLSLGPTGPTGPFMSNAPSLSSAGSCTEMYYREGSFDIGRERGHFQEFRYRKGL